MRDLGDLVAPTFADPEVEATFRRAGIVEVGAVLDGDAVSELRALADATRPEGDRGLVNDYRRDDRTRLRSVTERIRHPIAPLLEEVFTDHRLVLATFIAKYPGRESALVLHEDRTHVDESRFCAGNLWMPLDDVGPEVDNGALHLVAASHLIGDTVVGTATPDLWRPYEAYLEAIAEVPKLRAGEGIFYDNRTLHFSPPNDLEEVRLAVACLIVPKAAALRHAIAVGRRRRRVYEVDDEFFLALPPHRIDLAALAGYRLLEERVDTVELSAEAILAAVGDDGGRVTAADLDASAAPPGLPEGVRRRARSIERLTEDPPPPAPALRASDLSDGVAPGDLSIRVIRGDVGVLVVRSIAELPGWCAAVAPLLDGRRPVHVVQADPDAALAIESTERHGLAIDVVDAPPVACLLSTPFGVVTIDDDLALDVPAGIVEVWNHSLASLVVAVRAAAGPDVAAPAAARAPEQRRTWWRTIVRRVAKGTR